MKVLNKHKKKQKRRKQRKRLSVKFKLKPKELRNKQELTKRPNGQRHKQKPQQKQPTKQLMTPSNSPLC